ncbi:MAG: ABC transporter permease [Thermaerobacter sp.]|nr:ABC transporter permease [Bacillota bacterium]REJ37764.1 MAG: ABC transporter permease [Bacillota bacterium]
MGRRSPWRLLALVGPLAAWLLIFEVIPLVLVLAVSFMRRGVQGPIEVTFTLENYARFADPLYVRILADSLWIALVTTAICLLVGYPFAYYACQQPPERRARLLGLVILPFWTNMLIRTYAWIVLLRSNGLVNNVLRGAGVIQQPLELLYTREAAVLGLVYALLPFMILPLYASIEKLDWRLVKAAQDLGASPARAFWRVTLPLTMPGVVAGSVLVFVPSLALFYISDLMGGARAVLIGNLVQRQFTQARDWPFGAAASVILTVVSLLLIFVYVRYLSPDQGEEGPRA